jgi:hypothetical protein
MRKSSEIKDPNAFVFSLTNRDGQPCRIRVSKEWSSMSIDCHVAYGSSFGIGDIYICDNANENTMRIRLGLCLQASTLCA